MRKTRISSIIASSLLLTAGLSSGLSADDDVIGATAVLSAEGQYAGVNSIQSSSPIVDPNGIGDVLLFPYYTTVNGHATLVHLQNQDTERTVIAKIRFRDYQNSNDAVDFTVIMSPGDIFAGTVDQNASGTVQFTPSDNTCISPNRDTILFPDSTAAVNVSDSGVNHSGHIEVIVQGVIHNAKVLANPNGVSDAVRAGQLGLNTAQLTDVRNFVNGADHGTDTNPGDCAVVNSFFSATNNPRLQNIVTPITADTQGSVAVDFDNDGQVDADLRDGVAILNVLSGHYAIRGVGYSAAGRPVAVQNFAANSLASNTVGYDGADDDPNVALINPCGGVNDDLICDQGTRSLELEFPNLANVSTFAHSGNGDAVLDAGEEIFTLGTTQGRRAAFNALELALASRQTRNEWSNNEGNEVVSEMVVTFPTKYVRRDRMWAVRDESNIVDSDNRITVNTYFGSPNTATGNPASIANDLWNDLDGTNTAGTSAFALGSAFFDVAGSVESGCINYSLTLWDREEGSANSDDGGTDVSGGNNNVPNPDLMCNETNVFKFGENGVTDPDFAETISTTGISGVNQQFGWVGVTFNGETANDPDFRGIPNIGVAIWKRTFGNDVSAQFGQLIDNTKLYSTKLRGSNNAGDDVDADVDDNINNN